MKSAGVAADADGRLGIRYDAREGDAILVQVKGEEFARLRRMDAYQITGVARGVTPTALKSYFSNLHWDLEDARWIGEGLALAVGRAAIEEVDHRRAEPRWSGTPCPYC